MPAPRLLLAALLLPLAAMPAASQDYDRPPSGFRDGGGYDDGGYGRGSGADAGDAGAVAVRVGKLEGRIREMTGQIEELQNANRRLVEQVQKFQADVEFRLGAKGGTPVPAKRSDAQPGEGGPATDAAAPKAGSLARHGDAFDPGAAPAAPGAPKPLGSAASATPESGDAPMDLTGGTLRRSAAVPGNPGAIAPTLQLPGSAATPKAPGTAPTSSATATPTGQVTPNGTVIASTGQAGAPREEFDVALGYYREKQYENAEHGFAGFIQKNPKSRLLADATYYLGESYAQRGRLREAAEQYLKISTDFAASPRAPEAMLHLGTSLKALGAKEQACASFSEIGRKYPNAPAYVKAGAEREAKRAQC